MKIAMMRREHFDTTNDCINQYQQYYQGLIGNECN